MNEQECVLLKTSPEISLKTHYVRRYFTEKLVSNIKTVLRQNKLSGTEVRKKPGRLLIYSEKKKLPKIGKLMENIFGVTSVAFANKIGSVEKSEIILEAVKLAGMHFSEMDSFAVRVKRHGTHHFSSKQLEEEIGSAINQKINGLIVDLTSPSKELFVEVKDLETFFYTEESPAAGGLPLGCEGNVAVEFLGRKEELLAAWLMMKRGCNVFPLVEKKTKKIESHINKLKKWNSFRKFKLTELQDKKDLLEKKDIAVKAIVKADTVFSREFVAEKKRQPVPVFWPLVFYPEELFERDIKKVLG